MGSFRTLLSGSLFRIHGWKLLDSLVAQCYYCRKTMRSSNIYLLSDWNGQAGNIWLEPIAKYFPGWSNLTQLLAFYRGVTLTGVTFRNKTVQSQFRSRKMNSNLIVFSQLRTREDRMVRNTKLPLPKTNLLYYVW